MINPSWIDKIDLQALIQQFGSPLYIYDFSQIRQTYRRLRASLHPAIQLYYAVKANPNPAIVQEFITNGSGFDVSSGGELELVLAKGGNPAQISFAGPGKTRAELQAAVDAGVNFLSVEAISELKDIENIAGKRGRPASMMLRVNPQYRIKGFQIKMGGVPSPFGIDEEQLNEVLPSILKSKWLKLRGLHVYAGTQLLDENAIVENTQMILEMSEKYAGAFRCEFEYINIGGGWGVPYHEKDRPLAEERLISQLNERVAAFITRQPHTKLILELGRYLVGNAGIYVTEVVRVKKSRGINFLVLDGGMNHYLAASGNFGQVLRKNFPISRVNLRNQTLEGETYHIVGPLCTPIDRMGSNINLPQTREGDLVVFPQTGAYAYTASPLQFLGHPAPAEVAIDGNKTIQIRERIEKWV